MSSQLNSIDVCGTIRRFLVARDGVFKAKKLDHKQRQMVWDLFKNMQSQVQRLGSTFLREHDWQPILNIVKQESVEPHTPSSWIGRIIKGLLNFLGLRTSSGALCELARAFHEPLNPSKGSNFDTPLPSAPSFPAPVNPQGLYPALPQEGAAAAYDPLSSYLDFSPGPAPINSDEGNPSSAAGEVDWIAVKKKEITGLQQEVVELINKPSLQTEDIEEFKRVSAELLSAKKMYKDSLLINWPNFVREIVSEKKPMIAGFNESTLIDQQRLHHELAHTFIGLCMGLMDGFFHVTRPGRLLNENLLDLVNPEIKGEGFDPKFVSFEYTRGVKEDILRDSNNDNIRFVYTAASQFNGAEAKDRYLNAPGAAVEGYNLDYTQGPQAQLAFSPEQVEAINVAAHIGWNGLCDVLDDDTKRTLNFGYFTPNSTEFNRICQQLVENGSFIQYPVVTSTPTGGKSPVTMVLVAAPAFGIYVLKPCLDDEQRKLIEFLCAFNAFRAQLNTCFDIAKAKMVGKSQKIVLKVAAVGLGVFENNPDVVAKALYQALLIFSPRFESNNIEVRFQVFRNTNRADPNAQKVVHLLGLKECQPSF